MYPPFSSNSPVSTLAPHDGGSGAVRGPLVGALLIEAIREMLRLKTQYLALAVYGIMLILVGLFIPGGLMRLRLWHRPSAGA